MRLANFTNSGGKGAGSGWVLPVGVLSYCTNKHPYTRMETWQTKLADAGYSCALTCSSCNTLRCTIVDGTQYEFSLYQQGSALGLGVNILQ